MIKLARKRKYESAIDWLVASKLILINYIAQELATQGESLAFCIK